MASYPPFEDWFSTSIRRNRKSFMVATAALLAVLIVIVAVVAWFTPPSSGAFNIVTLPFLLAGVICTYMLTAQRLRDMGLTGWLALLWIPLGMADALLNGAASLAAFIVLCVVPGAKGSNRYGPDPLGEDQQPVVPPHPTLSPR